MFFVCSTSVCHEVVYVCSQGVLDYLDNLDLAQVRKLYQMLGRLAFSSLQQDSIIQVLVLILSFKFYLWIFHT